MASPRRRSFWIVSDICGPYHAVKDYPTPMAVRNLANALGIHPAIVACEVREREGYDLPLLQVVKLERLDVAHLDETRALALRQRVEIFPCLFVG